jgi:hypothetical protein
MKTLKQIFEGRMALEGSKIEFTTYASWKNALPKNADIRKESHEFIAQALGKDLEGIAGRFNNMSSTGWIYAYYLKPENLVHNTYSDAKAIFGDLMFKEEAGGDYACHLTSSHDSVTTAWTDIQKRITKAGYAKAGKAEKDGSETFVTYKSPAGKIACSVDLSNETMNIVFKPAK